MQQFGKKWKLISSKGSTSASGTSSSVVNTVGGKEGAGEETSKGTGEEVVKKKVEDVDSTSRDVVGQNSATVSISLKIIEQGNKPCKSNLRFPKLRTNKQLIMEKEDDTSSISLSK